MKRHPYLVLLALLVVGIGGNVAWQAYEDHRRMKVWETLLDGVDCSACAARKVSIAEKAAGRKAKRAALKNAQAVPVPVWGDSHQGPGQIRSRFSHSSRPGIDRKPGRTQGEITWQP